DAFPNDANETSDLDGDGVGDNADAFPNDANETSDLDGDGVGDNADAFDDDSTEDTDSDGDGVGDNADAFDEDANETADSDGDGVGDNADAFDDDPTEDTDSDGDGVGDNTDAFPDDAERSTDSSEEPAWSVVLKESGLDPNLVMGVIGIIIVMVGVFFMVSSRNVKKLKAERDEALVSTDMWDRLDFDKDGNISDLEFEAYKVIRDGGKKKPETKSDFDDTEDTEDSTTDETEEMSIEEMAGQDEDDSSGKGRYDF
ncbi:MAG: MSCRAMM family adhesin SdrC, partial [Candidatus Poseidoniaceae archaeon]|nr:MSCRAMM family adhesin SdrC [Candidatus Poseidoniaceae archaeon]